MLKRRKVTVAMLAALAALAMSTGLAWARDRDDDITIRVPGGWYMSPPPVVVNPPPVYYSSPPVYSSPPPVYYSSPPRVYSSPPPRVYVEPPTVYYGPSGYYVVR